MAAIVWAVLAGLFWAVGELCAKSALKSGEVGPVTAIAVRTSVALPVIWVLWLAATRGWLEPLGVEAAREPEGWTQASAATWWKLALGAGVSAGALGIGCFYLGLSSGDVSRVKPVAFALAPALAAVGAFVLLGESFSAKKLLGLVLIVGGIVVLTTRD
ncbi:MAG: EamA family transporter [Phycisphaerales bacterium]